MKTTALLGIGLVGNTASIIFAFLAFLIKRSLLQMAEFSLMMGLTMFNYLGGTLLIFIALGVWKKGIMLGKVSIISGMENILLGLLLVGILLQDIVKAPLIILPFFTGYGLIQQGKRAIALEKMRGSFHFL